jgi:hypothetical protein
MLVYRSEPLAALGAEHSPRIGVPTDDLRNTTNEKPPSLRLRMHTSKIDDSTMSVTFSGVLTRGVGVPEVSVKLAGPG